MDAIEILLVTVWSMAALARILFFIEKPNWDDSIAAMTAIFIVLMVLMVYKYRLQTELLHQQIENHMKTQHIDKNV